MNTKKIAGLRLGAKIPPTDPAKANQIAKEREDEFRQKVKRILKSKRGEK